jgi:hypothetical protein
MVFTGLLLLANQPLPAQSKWVYHVQANIGATVHVTYGKGQRFPGFRIYGAISIMGVHNKQLLVHYSPSLAIYSKTIGANLNPLSGDIQLDFTNTFSAGYGSAKDLMQLKYLRTLHNGAYYNVSTYKKNMLLLSSNFIVNNHHRNQIVGSITASLGNYSLLYANDGPPFHIIPLADNFDRYWTGSGAIFIHTRKGYNRAEISFDQFTGYTALLYELSNLIGINVPLYTDEESNSPKKKYSFNTSAYQLKVFTDANYSVSTGILGNLTDKKGRHYGIQELIHMALKLPLHPNNDMNRFFFGASYINNQNVK